MKIAKAWFQLLDTCFLLVTGYSAIDLLALTSVISVTDYLTPSNIGSFFVVILASIYWVFRLFEWLSFKKIRAEQEELKSNILRLEEEANKLKLKRLQDSNQEEE